jgi:hypothetical protein
MKAGSRVGHGFSLLLLGAAFIVSTYAVSDLMPLVLQIARGGWTVLNTSSLTLDLVALIGSVAFLAREIYRVDRRAGRIRNKVGWFE